MDHVVRWIGGRCGLVRAAVVAVFAGSVAACGSVMNMMPDAGEFRLPDRSAFVPTTTSNFGLPISPTNEVKSADLVTAQGGCAEQAAASRGVSLDMTECEVVRVLGQPESVDFTSASGSLDQRRVTLTYRGGERPGIYQFTAGRLTSVDRIGGDPAPAAAKKPAKKQKSQPAA
jgi:hypothetical protein